MKIIIISFIVLIIVFWLLAFYAIFKNNRDFDKQIEKIMKEQNKKNK